MKEINGCIIFEEEDMKEKDHPAIKALAKINISKEYEYGFQLVDTEAGVSVVALSRDEWQETISLVFPEQSPIPSISCRDVGGGFCEGACFYGGRCKRIYQKSTNRYVCVCSSI